MANDAAKTLDEKSKAARIAERAAALDAVLAAGPSASPEPDFRSGAELIQLSFWADDKRAMPTEFVRSSLFAAIHSKDASYLEGVQIANVNGLSITYTGHRLTQVDADVWEGIMHLARERREGEMVRFTARHFLRIIGRHTGKSQRDELRRSFRHLAATCVEVYDTKNKRRYWGSLLPRGADADEVDDTTYVVEINHDLAQLFQRGFSLIDWEQRKLLRAKPLCLWLQHFFADHHKPVQVALLHQHSGSTATLKGFRRQLRLALDELVKAQVLAAWRIDDADTAHVKPLSPEMRVVLAAKAKRTVAASNPAQVPLALPIAVSTKAREEFLRLHPGQNPDHCLADFSKWLSEKGYKADRPDAAFIGFARKWLPRS